MERQRDHRVDGGGVSAHRRLAGIVSLLAVLYVVASGTYMVCDHHSLGDSLWWAFMTFTTVGYGDQYPTSFCGRLAGVLLVMAAVFVVVPTITATIALRLIVDRDAWTHDEQEEVKGLLREIHHRVNE